MEFTVNKNAFASVLGNVSHAIRSKAVLPILTFVAIRTDDDRLVLEGTDLEIVIRDSVPANITQPGATCVPARILSLVVSELDGDEIQMRYQNGHLHVLARNSKFSINTLPHDEYPMLPVPEPDAQIYSIASQHLAQMINFVVHSIAPPNETRSILTGAQLRITSDGVAMNGTDGRRMAMSFHGHSGDVEIAEPSINVAPKSALVEVARMCGLDSGHVSLFFDSRYNVWFQFGTMTIIPRTLQDGKFPDIDGIARNLSHDKTMCISREPFLAALRAWRMMACERDSPNLVRLSLSQHELLVRANTPDVGDAEISIACRLSGEPMDIAFNWRYLSDALASFDSEEVTLLLRDPMSMIQISGGDDREKAIIMPVRVKDIASQVVQ